MIDVIILSNTQNNEYFEMCKTTISSLKKENTSLEFNIIIVETNSKSRYVFDVDHYIIMNEPFNYNKFLNRGLELSNSEYILILNNDLIFHKSSVENMVRIFNQFSDICSISPREPDYHSKFNFPDSGIVYGYNIPLEIVGWCIFARRRTLDTIGKFDEDFKFWYQDNDYANSLIKNNLKHVLCLNSHVTHLWSKSHNLLLDFDDMTTKQSETFNNKWKRNS
jgi:glycosyltransferase involved in cell wall biosynthesis